MNCILIIMLNLGLQWFPLILGTEIMKVASYSNDKVKFSGTVNTDGSVSLQLQVVTADQSGWIALGVSKNGLMQNSEIYMGNSSLNSVGRFWAAENSYSTPIRQSSTNVKSASVLAGGKGLDLRVVRIRAEAETLNSVEISITGADTHFIYAVGAMSSDGDFSKHSERGSFTVNFMTGAGGDRDLVKKIHGFLMILAWSFIIPNGIFLARFGKKITPSWYKIHRNVQIIAVLISLVSFGLIIYGLGGGLNGQKKHNVIGVIVVALSLLEICLGFYSNAMWKPGKPAHIIHDKMHWWIGRIVTVLAYANIMIAFFEFYETGKLSLIILGFVSLAGYLGFGAYLSFRIGQVHESSNDDDANTHEEGQVDLIKKNEKLIKNILAPMALGIQACLTIVLGIFIFITKLDQ